MTPIDQAVLSDKVVARAVLPPAPVSRLALALAATGVAMSVAVATAAAGQTPDADAPASAASPLPRETHLTADRCYPRKP